MSLAAGYLQATNWSLVTKKGAGTHTGTVSTGPEPESSDLATAATRRAAPACCHVPACVCVHHCRTAPAAPASPLRSLPRGPLPPAQPRRDAKGWMCSAFGRPSSPPRVPAPPAREVSEFPSPLQSPRAQTATARDGRAPFRTWFTGLQA